MIRPRHGGVFTSSPRSSSLATGLGPITRYDLCYIPYSQEGGAMDPLAVIFIARDITGIAWRASEPHSDAEGGIL
jgi:hypothetical protein